MLDMLGESVQLPDYVEALGQIYGDDRRLEDRTGTLSVILKAVIEEVILWFDKGASKDSQSQLNCYALISPIAAKWLSVLPLQGLYAQSFDVKRKALQQATADLKDQVDLLDKEKTSQILNAMNQFRKKLDQMLKQDGSISNELEAVRRLVEWEREERRQRFLAIQRQADRITEITGHTASQTDDIHRTTEETRDEQRTNHIENQAQGRQIIKNIDEIAGSLNQMREQHAIRDDLRNEQRAVVQHPITAKVVVIN
jgi:methyl-accepting chemotaxis protein